MDNDKNIFSKEYIRTFDWNDLDGKKGTLMVTKDSECLLLTFIEDTNKTMYILQEYYNKD